MDVKEKERIRKEKLAEFFFNLANTTAGTTVVGVIVSFAMEIKQDLALNIMFVLIFGVIMTLGLASVGNSFFKE